MNYVELGKTGLRISYLGLGGIPIQKCSEDGVKALMQKVHQEGINFIDSARGYTVSEALIGEAISGMREDFILATKSMARTYEEMKRDIGISLHQLKTEVIELYQVHNPGIADLEKVCGKGGALEALLEAKAEGKILHLGLTAHSLEVFEKALSLPWVETIMFPYNIVEAQGAQLIKECKEKGIGFICMKPLAGGAIENSFLALRYIRQNPSVTVIIPGMYDEEEVDKNCLAIASPEALNQEEIVGIEKIKASLGTHFCRRCNYCQPCPQQINISGCFLFEGYLSRYGLEDWARERYKAMPVKASACIKCGICETKCPYQLPIREMLKKCAQEFGE